MNVKIGRNDPCPCGSGKKYKKCWVCPTFYTRCFNSDCVSREAGRHPYHSRL